MHSVLITPQFCKTL